MRLQAEFASASVRASNKAEGADQTGASSVAGLEADLQETERVHQQDAAVISDLQVSASIALSNMSLPCFVNVQMTEQVPAWPPIRSCSWRALSQSWLCSDLHTHPWTFVISTGQPIFLTVACMLNLCDAAKLTPNCTERPFVSKHLLHP